MRARTDLFRRFCLFLVLLLPLALAFEASAKALLAARTLGPSLATGVAGVTLTPNPYVFANTAVGQFSSSQVFTFGNFTGSPFTPTSVGLSGANPFDFTVTGHTCSAPVANGGNCTITLRFAPTATGNRVALLSVTYPNPLNGGLPAQIDAVISGAGTAPVFALTPSPHVFAATTVGQASATQVFTFANNGGLAITMGGATLAGANPGDFVIDATTCTGQLADGANCTVTAHFAPGTAGARAALLRVSYDSGLPGSLDAAISGTGLAAPVASAPIPTLGGWGLLALLLGLAAAAGRQARRAA